MGAWLGVWIGAAIDRPEKGWIRVNEKNAKVGFWLGATIGFSAGYAYGKRKSYTFDHYRTLEVDDLQENRY
jgi:hypothetical protein